MKDPIVEEVRKARRKHTQRFNFDLHAICADLKKKEKEYGKKYGHPVKSLPPKTIQKQTANTAST